jgi:hypothetical protein
MLQVYLLKLDFSIYIRDIYLIRIWKYKFLNLFLYKNINIVKNTKPSPSWKLGDFNALLFPDYKSLTDNTVYFRI